MTKQDMVWDEYDWRKLPPDERFTKLIKIVQTEKRDESKRWDAVWLIGEICDKYPRFNKEVADIMEWILDNDKSQIVRHEAAFQIGLRNFRDKIGTLLNCACNDRGSIAAHEAIEALAAMRVQEDYVLRALKGLTFVDDPAIKDSAKFALKRLKRLKNKGAYRGEAVV